MKRKTNEGIEFLIITEWETFDAIKSFAGLEIDKAVIPKTVQDMMVRYDDTVSHYEILQK